MSRLQEDLTSTGLFDAIVFETDFPVAVEIHPEYSPRYCFSEPLIVAVTVGIIPQPSCYYSGYRLTLRGSGVPGGERVVDDRSQPRALWGWVAGPLTLLPEWSSSIPREEEVRVLRAAMLAAFAAP